MLMNVRYNSFIVFIDPDWEGKATLRYLTNQVETVKDDALCRG